MHIFLTVFAVMIGAWAVPRWFGFTPYRDQKPVAMREPRHWDPDGTKTRDILANTAVTYKGERVSLYDALSDKCNYEVTQHAVFRIAAGGIDPQVALDTARARGDARWLARDWIP